LEPRDYPAVLDGHGQQPPPLLSNREV
jgi:hypothetical protein